MDHIPDVFDEMNVLVMSSAVFCYAVTCDYVLPEDKEAEEDFDAEDRNFEAEEVTRRAVTIMYLICHWTSKHWLFSQFLKKCWQLFLAHKRSN